MNKQILIILLAITLISFVYASTCLGDTNGDGVADASDYINIKNHFGYNCSEVDCAGADLDRDGLVGWGDLMIFQANAGNNCNIKEPEPTPESVIEQPSQSISSGSACYTKWECSEWSSCSTLGKQTRTCTYKENWCKPRYDKPSENQTCNYIAPSVEKEIVPIVKAQEPEPIVNESESQLVIKDGSSVSPILYWVIGLVLLAALIFLGFKLASKKDDIIIPTNIL